MMYLICFVEILCAFNSPHSYVVEKLQPSDSVRLFFPAWLRPLPFIPKGSHVYSTPLHSGSDHLYHTPLQGYIPKL